MLRRSSLRIAVLTILMLSILLVAAQAQDFGKITDEEWAQGAPEDYPEADAIVLFDHGEMEVTYDADIFSRHVRIKILTADGVDQAGEHSIRYWAETRKLKGFKAHTITPDGKKHKIEKEAIFEKELDEMSEKVFTFPQLAAGVIVEYQYRLYSEYHSLSAWYFQTGIYTVESRLTAIVSEGWDYNVSYQNIPMAFRDPVVSDKIDRDYSDGRHITTFVWTMTNLAPVMDVLYMICVQDY